jgi:putative nucleotidyltransferase with HDIG domain
MEDFKETTLNNIAYYLQILEEEKLYIKLTLQIKKNIIIIEVRNNVTATGTEMGRINDRLVRSRQFKNMEDAFAHVLDDSEGAGLGLVILVLMLRKMGLDDECFYIKSNEKETVARISIPLDKVQVENVSLLSSAIVSSVKSLPHFPENILAVQRLISDPDTEIEVIARHMSMDPALTADVLRIVNSAQYMLVKRVDSISDAIRLLGIRGIRNLLYSYGTQRILGSDSAEKKELWEHSYKTAFYAYDLVKNFKRRRNLLEDAYVGGILHDIGKIVFSAVHPQLLDRLKAFCLERNIPQSTFEDFSAGMNHAEIGALIAEKWNFPASLVNVIRYHHDPESAPVESRDLVSSVYLANMLCEYEKGNVGFDQFEEIPLAVFGIRGKGQLDSLLGQLSMDFEKENKKA